MAHSDAPLSASNLKPCYHQVGGHMTADSVPDSYIDDEGRFYKPYTDGPRAEREIAFYKAIFATPVDGQPRPHAAYPCPVGQHHPASTPHSEPKIEDIEGLKPFIPKFWGTLEHNGNHLLALEDMCKIYKKPCVLDAKMGFTTIYDWADERYKTKFKVKDAETTQNSCGFRISGLQVHRAAEDVWVKPERQWSRDLTKENIGTAFELFASGGLLSAKDLYGHPTLGALEKLRRFEAWAQKQTSFLFFQASLLIMYEGEAKTMEEANLRVAFVDFAHCFQSLGANDDNLASSCASLISIIEKVAGV